MKYCYRIELDNTGTLSGRPYFWYVIADTMEQACAYVQNHKDRDWQHKIISCKLMGDAGG